jgi:hypothetical protein
VLHVSVLNGYVFGSSAQAQSSVCDSLFLAHLIMQTSDDVVIAEGLWRNPGQAPRSLILGASRKDGLWETGGVFDSLDLQALHGFWRVVSNADDSASPMLSSPFTIPTVPPRT